MMTLIEFVQNLLVGLDDIGMSQQCIDRTYFCIIIALPVLTYATVCFLFCLLALTVFRKK